MLSEQIKTPEKKISAREQIIFDIRFAIALFLSSGRINVPNFSAEEDFDESPKFARELCRLEAKEMCSSRKINSLLEKFGVNFAAEGAENIPPEPVIFLARHESWWDTVGLQDILQKFAGREHPAKYLAKKELFQIPIFGTAMRRVGHMPIDRESKNSGSRENIKFVLEKLKRDAIVFFEGTRKKRGTLSDPAEKKYRKAMVLARLGVPLVPVFIDSHSLGRDEFYKKPLPKRARRISENSKVQLRFGVPLDFKKIKKGELENFIRAGVEEFELRPGEKIKFG